MKAKDLVMSGRRGDCAITECVGPDCEGCTRYYPITVTTLKAADTVMTERKLDKLWDKYEKEDPNEEEDWGMLVARKQAKLSFKAGYEQRKKEVEMTTISLAELCWEHRQAGIKEVVEWIENKRGKNLPFLHISEMYDEYLEKLKDWGIKE